MTERRNVREWHDESDRFARTGRLDEGPCWCAGCIADEQEGGATG